MFIKYQNLSLSRIKFYFYQKLILSLSKIKFSLWKLKFYLYQKSITSLSKSQILSLSKMKSYFYQISNFISIKR